MLWILHVFCLWLRMYLIVNEPLLALWCINSFSQFLNVLCSCVRLNLRHAVLRTTGYYMHWAFTNHMYGNIRDWMLPTPWCQSVRCVITCFWRKPEKISILSCQWVIPRVIEYCILLQLNRLVTDKWVDGWDDPRLMTLAGLRRRGVTPTAINAFVRGVGITRRYAFVQGVYWALIKIKCMIYVPLLS